MKLSLSFVLLSAVVFPARADGPTPPIGANTLGYTVRVHHASEMGKDAEVDDIRDGNSFYIVCLQSNEEKQEMTYILYKNERCKFKFDENGHKSEFSCDRSDESAIKERCVSVYGEGGYRTTDRRNGRSLTRS